MIADGALNTQNIKKHCPKRELKTKSEKCLVWLINWKQYQILSTRWGSWLDVALQD